MRRMPFVKTREVEHWLISIFRYTFMFLFVMTVTLVMFHESIEGIGVLMAVGATAIASSAYITLMSKDNAAATPRVMVVSYILAITVSMLLHPFVHLVGVHGFMSKPVIYCIGSALAGVSAMAVLNVFKLNHPPAIGVSIALTLDPWDARVLVIIILSILILAGVRYFSAT